jgi:HEAT repeat protein
MTGRLSSYLTLTLFLVCTALFTSGCNESLQSTYSYPDAVSARELVPAATQIIREGLADDDPDIRPKAIEVVADTKLIKLMPKVKRLLKDESVRVRFLAALAAGDLEYSLARSDIEQLLEDEDENVRIAAAYAMYKFGLHENFKIIRKAIASNDQTVRANAALLLGKCGDRSVLKFLWWTMGRKDSADKVKFNAAEAIARLGDERIYPKLWAMLISAYHDDRVFGAAAMGTLGTVEARDALITMLDDDILEVRLAAAEQLGMLGETIGEPEVLDVYRKNMLAGLSKKGTERVKVLTALAIGQICTEQIRRFLPQLLQDDSKYVRIAAAKAVFQCMMKD